MVGKHLIQGWNFNLGTERAAVSTSALFDLHKCVKQLV